MSGFSDSYKKCGSLWKGKTKNGNIKLSLNLNGKKYMALKNNKRDDHPGDPDFIIYEPIQNQTNSNVKPPKSTPTATTNTDDDLEW